LDPSYPEIDLEPVREPTCELEAEMLRPAMNTDLDIIRELLRDCDLERLPRSDMDRVFVIECSNDWDATVALTVRRDRDLANDVEPMRESDVVAFPLTDNEVDVEPKLLQESDGDRLAPCDGVLDQAAELL
jgi:hypothetical protein